MRPACSSSGGIGSHYHIEQMSSIGIMNADDFYSGTVSAAFGERQRSYLSRPNIAGSR
jgi:hypothetical protein